MVHGRAYETGDVVLGRMHVKQEAVQAHGSGTADAPIKAILVFTDPDDWGRDLQLCCDVMLCGGVLPGLRPPLISTDGQLRETPIYFSQDGSSRQP
jgi:hypothetical protein